MFSKWVFCYYLLLLKIMVSLSPAVLLTHRPRLPWSFACLSVQAATHQRYAVYIPGTFPLETCFVRLWQTLFYYPSNISLSTIWWLGNRTILLSNKINVPATWQNIQRWSGFALGDVRCLLWVSLQWDTKDAISSSEWDGFVVPAALLFHVRVLIMVFSCHLGQLSLLLSVILAYE